MTDKVKAFLQRIVSECNQLTVTGIDNACHVVNIKLLCDQAHKVIAEGEVKNDESHDEQGENV